MSVCDFTKFCVYLRNYLSLALYPISWHVRVVHYLSHMYVLDHQPLVDRASDTNVFLLQYLTLRKGTAWILL